jgi:crotonobetainyl-CoA:carnitine CoA-transferase CaiB-like acyl-CoA transferase
VTDPGGPLAGVRVVELGTTFMVPYATELMAQMGAEVIKVEPPAGDLVRWIADPTGRGVGPVFMNANRGKRSVRLDLRDDGDYAAFLRLVERCDVFVHNRTPRSVASLRIGHAELSSRNPGLVYCAVRGYGEEGCYRDRPAYDDVIQAASGLAAAQTNGGEPSYVRTPVADKTTGVFALSAVLAALFERERSGRGQAVEVPMFECMAAFTLFEQQGGYVYDPPRGPTGYARTAAEHRRPYRTADGLLGVTVYTDEQWRRFFALVDRADLAADPRFGSVAARNDNVEELYAFLADVLRTRSTQEWMADFVPAGIPAMPVHGVEDLFDDPHLADVGFFRAAEQPGVGRVRFARFPIRFSRTPAGSDGTTSEPAAPGEAR